MKVNCVRKYITQPVSWWEAFEQAAQAEGLSISEWLGRHALNHLPRSQRLQLKDQRRTRGRPRQIV